MNTFPECCMSNCAVCVYDLYEESLDDYRKSIADLRTALSARGIPEGEWPQDVRSATAAATPVDRKEAVLNAFEELERALAKKHHVAQVTSAGQPFRETPGQAKVTRRQARRSSWVYSITDLYEGLQWILFGHR
ncbi:hypothetical protein C0993_007193 [Termitomyces sp. T159_Od127]|nr:hypothetical protein C0993_007193 [Termitomyces sp. T159_Od127]